MAVHSRIFAWKMPWTEEPGGLQSMGSQSQTLLSTCTHASSHMIHVDVWQKHYCKVIILQLKIYCKKEESEPLAAKNRAKHE